MRDVIYFPCRIKVGAKSINPTRRMVRCADHNQLGWFGVDAQSFQCRSCGLKWDATDFGSNYLRQVSCSSCYSDNVVMTAIRVEMPPAGLRGEPYGGTPNEQ